MEPDQQIPSASPWLSAEASAVRADVSPAKVLRDARAGKLRGYRVGGGRLWRFRIEDVDAWISGASPTPAGAHHRPRVLPSNGAAA
jgi:excisionase family DNA binding protein